MPEGDTIAYAALRLRRMLVGAVPELDPRDGPARGWAQRVAGRDVQQVDSYGKHLFIRFAGDLSIHSHLRMTGLWQTGPVGQRWRRAPRRAWLVLRARGYEAVQFDGPVLELMTGLRARNDPRIAALGPDILGAQWEPAQERDVIARLRADDPTRTIGDALLDQRIVAGLGTIWRAEACYDAQLNPWRAVAEVDDAAVLGALRAVRPRMQDSARGGRQMRTRHAYGQRRCERCGGRIRCEGMGDDHRVAYWCPACQQ